MRFVRNIAICAALIMSHASVVLAEGDQKNREGKHAYAAYEVIGLTMMPVSGLRLGYFINPNLVAEVSYLTGSAKIGSFESRKSLMEAKAKYFLGETFYVDGGFAHESWGVNYSVLKSGGTLETADIRGKVTNTGIDLHIGNQWQWEGFTLGCDWVGYFLNLSTSTSYGSTSGLDTEDQKSEEAKVKKNLGGSSAHVTRFYIGWSF
ncbi:MAG: hypothetical protein WCO71_00565 [Pseudomonadota bacterium]